MENQKNLILAIIFSVIVLLVFDIFFKPKKPINPEETINVESNTNQTNKTSDESLLPTISNKDIASQASSDMLPESRIYFDMQRIKGSINLFGATLDDVILKDHKESIHIFNYNSPN